MIDFKFHRATFVFRLLSTVSSLSLAGWIFAVNKNITLGKINAILLNYFDIEGIRVSDGFINFLNSWWSYLIYFLIILTFAYWTTIWMKGIDVTISLSENQIDNISSAGEEMGLTYFGLFFYALSLGDVKTFILTFIVLCIGLTLTTQHMFNPLYLFLGYKYYNLETNTSTLLLISKQKYQYNDSVSFDKLALLTPFSCVEL